MTTSVQLNIEKLMHEKDNKMFLKLLKKIWEDKECLKHMKEETFQEFLFYAESWDWR